MEIGTRPHPGQIEVQTRGFRILATIISWLARSHLLVLMPLPAQEPKPKSAIPLDVIGSSGEVTPPPLRHPTPAPRPHHQRDHDDKAHAGQHLQDRIRGITGQF